MSTNMLGIDSVTLRKLWCGPLADLVVKLTGKNGPRVQEELSRFSREEPCWLKSTESETRESQGSFDMEKYQFSVSEILGAERADWKVIRDDLVFDNTAIRQLDLKRVRFVPAGPIQTALRHRGYLRENGYLSLADQSFMVCWLNRRRLPNWWRDLGNIYFDGFALQAPVPEDQEPFDFQYVMSMTYEGNQWHYNVDRIDGSLRHTRDASSAVFD